MANAIVRGTCFNCGRDKNLRWNHALDRGECRACRASRAPQERCAGCGRQRRVNPRTPDGGAICVTCYARLRTTDDDACDECGTVGALATRAGGKSQAARNLCTRCYRNPRRSCGICGRLKRIALKATATSPDVCPTCYQAPVIDCSICGQQALGRRTTNRGRPRCFACQAAAQIEAALTGPDGMIRSELQPVRDALTATSRPRSLLSNWHDLASLHLVAEIAQGQLGLTHDALDARPQSFSVTYLRAMLIAAGALPPRPYLRCDRRPMPRRHPDRQSLPRPPHRPPPRPGRLPPELPRRLDHRRPQQTPALYPVAQTRRVPAGHPTARPHPQQGPAARHRPRRAARPGPTAPAP